MRDRPCSRLQCFAPLLALGQASGQGLVYARLLAGLTLEDAAALCGLHPRTLRRQETGRARPSLACYRLLEILAGRLPWSAWAGWECIAGTLRSPQERREYRPADLYALHWLRQLLAARRLTEQPFNEDRPGDGRRRGPEQEPPQESGELLPAHSSRSMLDPSGGGGLQKMHHPARWRRAPSWRRQRP
jgi:transcriptional regulator with XRE-family HTH domain